MPQCLRETRRTDLHQQIVATTRAATPATVQTTIRPAREDRDLEREGQSETPTPGKGRFSPPQGLWQLPPPR